MTSSPWPALALLLPFGAVLALAPPASAQTDPHRLNQLTAQQNEQWAQQQAADQRAISQRNELEALDAKVKTQERLQQLQTQRASGQAQPLPYRDSDPVYAPKPVVEPVLASKLAPEFPSIPDAALAASRARVVAAARNRR